MSAIVATWCRDGMPEAAAPAAQAMRALVSRGPDGARTVSLAGGALVLGHQHLWSTPEELGEQQPLVQDDVAVSFDGRIDNRSELLHALQLDAPSERCLSDAALVLRGYARWGSELLPRLVGPFALAVFDVRRRKLLLGRDGIGTRAVAVFRNDRLAVVASEPAAVAAVDQVGNELDRDSIGCWLALLRPDEARTLFSRVRMLPPGHALEMTENRERQWRFWQPDCTPVRFASDEQYAARFRELLERSVLRRCRAPGRVGVLMSGGLDSSSVAATLAGLRGRAHRGVRTFSYVFDTLPACDERHYIDQIASTLHLDAELVPGDTAWPLRGGHEGLVDGNLPPSAYAALLDRVCRASVEAGMQVLLTGYGGDELYSGAEDWLASLLAEGRVGEALGEMGTHVRKSGWRAAMWSRTVRRALRWLAPVPSHPRPGPAMRPHWMTDEGWSQARRAARVPQDRSLAWRCWPIAVNNASHFGETGVYRASIPGLELRSPYRDRDLVTFMANVPAHQLYHHGRMKHVLRNAMLGSLPRDVVDRVAPTDLTPFFRLGLRREARLADEILSEPGALWPDYVHDTALRQAGSRDELPSSDDELVYWHCVALGLWQRHRGGAGCP